jgi:transposase-like protein
LIRRTKQITRRRFTPEEKVRILIEGFRKEIPVSVLCPREGIGIAVVRQWQEAGIRALVWDRAPSHRAKLVKAVGLPLIEQPPAAPELNPAERVFEELRREVEGRVLNHREEDGCAGTSTEGAGGFSRASAAVDWVVLDSGCPSPTPSGICSLLLANWYKPYPYSRHQAPKTDSYQEHNQQHEYQTTKPHNPHNSQQLPPPITSTNISHHQYPNSNQDTDRNRTHNTSNEAINHHINNYQPLEIIHHQSPLSTTRHNQCY